MRTRLLWCVFTCLVCTATGENITAKDLSRVARPVGISRMEIKPLCPVVWKFSENQNVCLGPIGEFVDYSDHQRTCSLQHTFGRMYSPVSTKVDVFDVCTFALRHFDRFEAMYFYIGATRKNGVFKWVGTDEPVDMTFNWAKGEPDGTDANPQNCLVMSMSKEEDKICKFYDQGCGERLPAVCGIQDAYPCAGLTNGGCEQLCIVNDARSRICACYPGYNEFDNSCVEKDECKIANGGCEQICTNKPGSYICSCREGYRKLGKFDCEEIKEPCKINNGGCHHYCHTEKGKVVCSCMDGFAISANSSKCYKDPNTNSDSDEAATDKEHRQILFMVLPVISAVFAITIMAGIIFVGISHKVEVKQGDQPVNRLFNGASMEVNFTRRQVDSIGQYHRKYGTGV